MEGIFPQWIVYVVKNARRIITKLLLNIQMQTTLICIIYICLKVIGDFSQLFSIQKSYCTLSIKAKTYISIAIKETNTYLSSFGVGLYPSTFKAYLTSYDRNKNPQFELLLLLRFQFCFINFL